MRRCSVVKAAPPGAAAIRVENCCSAVPRSYCAYVENQFISSDTVCGTQGPVAPKSALG